jgi:hypothetical protein
MPLTQRQADLSAEAFDKAGIDELTTLVNHVERLAFACSRKIHYMRKGLSTPTEALLIESGGAGALSFWKTLFRDKGTLAEICSWPAGKGDKTTRAMARLYKRGKQAIEKTKRCADRMSVVVNRRLKEK